MRIVDIIADKRDGKILTQEQISAFISGYASGSIPDYQAAAWCMAVFFRGMTPQETGFLTRAMIDSGEVMDLSSLSGPFVDKHSTGGVGDKISLILAPLAAACSVKVPMMSGRALGHTGGTLDKLESIPGYSSALSAERFVRGIDTVGYAMIGQSETMVPADRKLYALRDVIAAVESIPLITGSILSKKFAEGADSLVMDVKCGKGAFMKTRDDARKLADSLVRTGGSLGKRIIAVITDMSEPLGRKVGNFLEVEESVDVLRGDGPQDVKEVTFRLCAWMLVAAGVSPDLQAAKERCLKAIDDGSALKKFRDNVAYQGGDPHRLDEMLGRARAKYSREISAEADGFIREIDAFSIGMAAVALGVGRNKSSDSVEALAGLELLKKSGDSIRNKDVMMRLWAEDEARLDDAQRHLEGSYVISREKPMRKESLILEEIAE